MAQLLLIGIGAGMAAALLFGSVASGTLLSIVLFYIAALPIVIAGLGWSHYAALLAAATGSLGLALALNGKLALVFAGTVGLPAWWLAYLALLARPAGEAASGEDADVRDGLAWYPIGRLLTWIAAIAGAIVLVSVPSLGFDLETYRAEIARSVEHIMRAQLGTPEGAPLVLPNGGDAQAMIALFIALVPIVAASGWVFTTLIDFYLAARIVRASGRLPRPWPSLAATKLPRLVLPVTALVLALSFLPGWVGFAGTVFAASFLVILALIGFAVMHSVIAKGSAGRGFILGGLYAAVLILGWPILGMALLGAADTALDIRARAGRRGGPKPPGT